MSGRQRRATPVQGRYVAAASVDADTPSTACRLRSLASVMMTNQSGDSSCGARASKTAQRGTAGHPNLDLPGSDAVQTGELGLVKAGAGQEGEDLGVGEHAHGPSVWKPDP